MGYYLPNGPPAVADPEMQARSLMLLATALLLGSGVGFAVLSHDTFAIELPPDTPRPPTSPPVRAEAAEPPPIVTGAAAGDHVSSDPVAPVAAVATRSEQRADTTGWTSGTIRGDIQLAVSVLDRLQTITVAVEEYRNPANLGSTAQRPYRRFVVVERGVGTPTFEVTNVPFSEYPYIVSVHSPGLNGGGRTVTIDAEHALVDDIVLTITPGAPFTLLVRDQDSTPMPNIDVRLLPVGEPGGRPHKDGKSDNYGSIVYEDLLAGGYQAYATQNGQPLLEPQTINVQPGNTLFHNRVQGQGLTLTVPRGVSFELTIADGAGYGIADAEVTAVATDHLKPKELPPILTDGQGRATFPHLTPGTWQVTVTKDLYQRADLQVAIKDGMPPQQMSRRLVRLR